MARPRGSALVNRPEWREIVEEVDPFRFVDRQEALLATLTEAEVSSLGRVCRAGSERERYVALSVLWELSIRSDTRLRHKDQLQLQRFARDEAKRGFPRTPLGLLAFQIWRGHGRAEAESFLVDEADVEGAGAEGLLAVVSHLRAFASERSRKKLESLRDLAPRIRAERDAAVAALRASGPEGLDELTLEWRRRRSGPALERLFLRLIGTRAPGTIPVEEVIQRLGRPTRRTGRLLYFEPSLVVEIDDRDRVAAYHFS